jgi:hypothetical protein
VRGVSMTDKHAFYNVCIVLLMGVTEAKLVHTAG